jgi:hypothetical protein
MNKYISSSATVGVWAPGAWCLELDVFILSRFPAFLILISVPVFPSFPSFASVFKNKGPRCGSSTVTLVYPVNSVILSKGKITKRTQFKNRTTRHPSQLQETT